MALRPNAAGTSVVGLRRDNSRDITSTPAIEEMAAAMTIFGRSVTSKFDRNNASRGALPATCWAIMVVAANSANSSALLS